VKEPGSEPPYLSEVRRLAPRKGSTAASERVGLKGKCALGPFLSILVIECQHKVLKCESMPVDGQVANHK
jgi:hypothetical protein